MYRLRSSGEKRLSGPPIAFQVSSTARLASARRRCFSFEKTCSIGVQVGAVGRQKQQPCASGADRHANSLALVAAEIIHHDDVAGFESRNENLIDISLEGDAADRAVEGHGRDHSRQPKPRDEGRRFPMLG